MDRRWIDRIAKPNTERVPLVVGHCTRAREMASGVVRLLVFLKSHARCLRKNSRSRLHAAFT